MPTEPQPTEEMVKMARQICERIWLPRNEGAAIQMLHSGQCDHYREVQAALAAIIETTERAAKLADSLSEGAATALSSVDWRREKQVELDTLAQSSAGFATALRNGDHLHD